MQTVGIELEVHVLEVHGKVDGIVIFLLLVRGFGVFSWNRLHLGFVKNLLALGHAKIHERQQRIHLAGVLGGKLADGFVARNQ